MHNAITEGYDLIALQWLSRFNYPAHDMNRYFLRRYSMPGS
jgi:hypothetical protein